MYVPSPRPLLPALPPCSSAISLSSMNSIPSFPRPGYKLSCSEVRPKVGGFQEVGVHSKDLRLCISSERQDRCWSTNSVISLVYPSSLRNHLSQRFHALQRPRRFEGRSPDFPLLFTLSVASDVFAFGASEQSSFISKFRFLVFSLFTMRFQRWDNDDLHISMLHTIGICELFLRGLSTPNSASWSKDAETCADSSPHWVCFHFHLIPTPGSIQSFFSR